MTYYASLQFRRILGWSAVALMASLMLSSCAPAPSVAPSAAVREQLQQIMQQQQQLQERLETIEGKLGIHSIASTSPPPVVHEPTGPQPVFVPQTSQQLPQAPDARAYTVAFTSFAGARYAAAEEGFEQFLRQYVGHPQAVNARFWLASAQLSQGKTQPAVSNYQQITTDPTAQNKAPAALLQLARIYRQQGRTGDADTALDQLQRSYPDSPEAQQMARGTLSPQQHGTSFR